MRRHARAAASLVLTVVVALGFVLALEALLIKPYKIPTGSMEPTLAVNERVLVDRLAGPADGRIVVFHPPVGAEQERCPDPSAGVGRSRPCDAAATADQSEYFIKRVIAGPGQRLAIRAGQVYVDGRPLRERYARPCGSGPQCSFSGAITVPAGDWFMMGDNRGDSDDSRFWGPVPRAWIIGTAFAAYWPPDRIGTL